MKIQKSHLLAVAILSGMVGTYMLIHSFAALDLSGVTVKAFDSLAQLRPDKPVPAGGADDAHIVAAKNEYESFQVLVKAGPAGITGAQVDLSAPLTGPGNAQIPADNVMIYREADYNVAQASDGEGGTGLWPDALIPKKDAFYGETRNAFPVTVSANGQVAVWVDVLVPANQAAGDYTGTIRVSAQGATVKDIPVHLKVANFSLPSTPSEKSMFFIDSYYPCTVHTGNYNCNGNQDQAWQLSKLYAQAGLNNRTTIPNPLPNIYGDSGEPTAPLTGVPKAQFEQKILPLINGTDSGTQLSGASLTSVATYWYCAHTGTTCLADWKQAATQYGFADKFYLYLCDEPHSAATIWNAECKPNATRANQIWPAVNKLVTTNIQDATTNNATGLFNTIAPVVNELDVRSGNTNTGQNKRSSYDSYLGQAGNQLWLYTSCESFGCPGEDNGAHWNGWPGYAIDEPASEQRAMGWMTFNYGATGELYWDVSHSLATAWTNQLFSGGSGDGNLFYPGTPGAAAGGPGIGGTHDIPIESIRLKRIRDGREDYEYLKKLADSGKNTQAMSVIQGAFGPQSSAMFNTDISGSEMNDARCQLLQLITGTDLCTEPAAPPSVKGDVTGPGGTPDGKIDLQDISFLIRHYNTTDTAGDISGSNGTPDGKVDIYDMSYAIRNYGG